MLLDISEIRNRMLSCRTDADITIAIPNGKYDENVELTLGWDYGEDKHYQCTVSLWCVTGKRPFEREMHLAKRAMRKG